MIYLNRKKVNFGEFPNGESYIRQDDLYIRGYNYVQWNYENERELVQLAILKSHLDINGNKAALSVLYVPHSRMDRRNTSYTFSLLAITNIINGMDWDSVKVMEPHSDVTPAALQGCYVENWVNDHIFHAMAATGASSLFYPDAGAQKRYEFPCESAVGFKTRDFKTGKITDFSLNGVVHRNVLIVDDCCSRGGTLVHSARLLRKKGATKVFGLVCYCENTVFEGEVLKELDGLYIAEYNVMSRKDEKLILI